MCGGWCGVVWDVVLCEMWRCSVVWRCSVGCGGVVRCCVICGGVVWYDVGV